jgi:nitrate reductase gamma subunit
MLVADVNAIFKLHLFLGMTILLVFPFTRLAHVWSAPIWYLGRRDYQVLRSKRSVAAAVVRSSKSNPRAAQAPRPIHVAQRMTAVERA